jgi:hypothetical protein
MALLPAALRQYHVFLASPGDVSQEREVVRRYFDRFNRHIGELWNIRFEVLDWENYATIGVGAPQELITKQTLDRYRDSLALVIGLMGQRFGSPTKDAESGTEEEFRWALQSFKSSGFPEIKWFFKNVEQFVAPPDPGAISVALEQWQKVCDFKQELKKVPLFISEYKDLAGFKDTFESDLNRWLHDPARPWIAAAPHREEVQLTIPIPDRYLEAIERDFHRLDIAGIDNDRAFEIPLSEIYVRLRVMFDEEFETDDKPDESGLIDIQTALLRYPKLVIAGDPGSGKSTFLKYVALMLARAMRANNPSIALEKLSLQEPLPLPIFISCWDLSDFLKRQKTIDLESLLQFFLERVTAYGFPIKREQLIKSLAAGNWFVLFDGLDEVPTDAGRAAVSRLLEDLVKTYGNNRYLITSRVRAYTGDTILKGEFARADIQPFDAGDRAQFLSNWVGLLFRTAPEAIAIEGTEPNREFRSVTTGIETSDRIRPLAVNPLLLTVIAIVHWNRKRLPEQRIDLYDECVDVLLGQRKEAEHVQLSRKTGSLDEQQEQEQLEERAWVRKRFGEIALHILSGEANRDETSKGEIVRLLAPRFIDQGATTQELAETRATHFLTRQELSSGLLVSRREQSYRFVHLTFQEYLAAWYLANQEFDNVIEIILPRLRQQRWFETLQLLGSEWAKQSDEKLDRYVAWLLDQQGRAIGERAPVIALCANIVKDVTGIAELKPQTRDEFRRAVEGTLDAFRPGSGIPAFTQLEILEALGQLGAAVKPHLIAATKSGLYQVRRRAVEMLLVHLGDDDLFAMGHLLGDRSKEPVKTYLRCLLTRDPKRTEVWLRLQETFPGKATDAFAEVISEFRDALAPEAFRGVVQRFFDKGHSHSDYFWYSFHYPMPARARLMIALEDESAIRVAVEADPEVGVRIHALITLVERYASEQETWDLVHARAHKDENFAVRYRAFELLAKYRDSDETWALIRAASISDGDYVFRRFLLTLIAERRKDDDETWKHLRIIAKTDREGLIRRDAVELIAARWPDAPETWQFMYTVVLEEKDPQARLLILSLLWKRLNQNPQVRELLANSATSDESAMIRQWAFFVVVTETFEKPRSKQLLSRDLNGQSPAWDPREIIGDSRVAAASSKLRETEAEIREHYEHVADKLQRQWSIELKLQWQ